MSAGHRAGGPRNSRQGRERQKKSVTWTSASNQEQQLKPKAVILYAAYAWASASAKHQRSSGNSKFSCSRYRSSLLWKVCSQKKPLARMLQNLIMNVTKRGFCYLRAQRHTCGTALLPKMPLRIARQRPTITSSLMFSMMPAASPATRARRIGAMGRQQKELRSTPASSKDQQQETIQVVWGALANDPSKFNQVLKCHQEKQRFLEFHYLVQEGKRQREVQNECRSPVLLASVTYANKDGKTQLHFLACRVIDQHLLLSHSDWGQSHQGVALQQ